MHKFSEIQAGWFSPVQMLELDACTRCLECIDACPVIRAGFPDGAKNRIDGWRSIDSPSSRILARIFKHAASERKIPAVFSNLSRCTTCGACSVVCESAIDIPSLSESMRGASREMGVTDASVEKTAETIVRVRNPYDGAPETRNTWIPEDMPVADSARIGFFAGCTIAFRQPEVGRAALRILAGSKTEFCMLGNRESCCGSFLFRTGSWKEYSETITMMIEDFQKQGVETLLISCAGCLKTITIDWPRVYGRPLPFKTMSFAVFIRDLIRDQKIRFSSPLPCRVVYHDPCHGGRHLIRYLGRDRVFEAPREVLLSIPGLELVEFPENREFQICCGAGGGVKAGDPGLAGTIAQEKLDRIRRLDADIVASTCPFCRRNLEDARLAAGLPVEVIDVIELVDRMMDR
ncbi:MAG: heterodisulfide reductase-related iron-sulfur binding cluster [Methanoregula sp.]|nr:heterodisulfide reductase-related iron-sulfur binding cluster [Methanoregula sp.]